MGLKGALTVCGAMLLLVPAASASGAEAKDGTAKGYRYVSVADTVSDNAQEGLTAICPGDEPVVGGGVATNGLLAARVEVNTTQPFDDDADLKTDDGWEAWVDNVNSGDAEGTDYRVFAICDKRAAEKDYRYVSSASAAAPEGEQARVDATCPGNEPVISGGVRSSGFLNDEMKVNTSGPRSDGAPGEPPSDGWVSFVDNVAVGNPGMVITGYAICDKRRQEKAYAYRSKVATSIEGEQNPSAKKCPKGGRLVGGGNGTSGFFADRMYATTIAPFGSGPIPDTYRTAVNNLSGGGSGNSVTAFAICRK